MIKTKHILTIVLLSILFTGCVNSNEKKAEESIQSKGIDNTYKPTKQPVKTEPYQFYDESVKSQVELYFDKKLSELNEDNYKALSELDYCIIDEPIKTLKDISNLFPNIKYLNITSNNYLSKEDCDILKSLPNLKALTIYTRPTDNLEFAKDLPYFEISYKEKDCKTDKNNLTSFYELGEDFISKNVEGTPLKYICVKDNNTVYELVVTDQIEKGEFYSTQKRFVFISNKKNERMECKFILNNEYMIGDYSDNKIILADVNFDEKKDILIEDGGFGAQQMQRFTCYLKKDGAYEECKSFSDIGNPHIDEQNKKILGSWRDGAVGYGWEMYAFDGTEFVLTDCLTKQLIYGETDKDEDEAWEYIIEKQVGDELQEMEVFTSKDLTDKEIYEKIYDENSDWALSAEKWNNLYMIDKVKGLSIYRDSYIDTMILDLISR